MNRRAVFTIILILLFNLLFVSISVYSLSVYQPVVPADVAVVGNKMPLMLDGSLNAATLFEINGRVPATFGGGEHQGPMDEISEVQRRQIEAAIAQNQTRLRAENKLPADVSETAVALSWPLQAASHLTDFGYHGTANFVDQNGSFPNALLDYACGQRTYDTYSGYNHPGTDIFTWPFPWNRMDNNEVYVVAAAPGIIIFKDDGNYDRNCSFTGLPWNAVYIQHADGSMAWYGHMKNGSVTTKPVGSSVARGELLGIVGSSGSSTGPHLHFELHDAFNQIDDPYAGVCNFTNPDSLWLEQPPYYDSAVNLITTGYGAPSISSCSTPEQSRAATEFNPGDSIYFTTYYRDQLGSLPSRYTIYEPDGSVYQSWEHGIQSDHYAASWWYWSFDFAPEAPQGYWEYEVLFNNQVYTHTFLVGTPPPPPPPEPAPVITVTVPNGGEIIPPGAILTVTWSTILTDDVQVDLFHNGDLSRTLGVVMGAAGNGRITTTIPISAETAAGYKVRVTNVLSSTVYDESDNDFVIGILDEHIFLPVSHKP